MQEIDILPEFSHINEVERLFFAGNLDLLRRPKIAIVGSRHPNPYAQSITRVLAARLAAAGFIIVSGGALGTDIIAHSSAGAARTIMISPSSLDIIYPAANRAMITKIYEQGLILSQFAPTFRPTAWSFLQRNKLVISLASAVIIPHADHKSGSMMSARYALEQGRDLFVLPHHLGQSEGTQELAQSGRAQVIWSVEGFLAEICGQLASSLGGENAAKNCGDELLEFCRANPLYDEVFARFGERVFEYELEGKILRENGRVRVAAL